MFDPDLTIKGGAFTAPTELKGILSDRMNIVYGHNGSGKSTVARAFREQQLPAPASIQVGTRQYELSFDGTGTLPQQVRESLFVFNEEFVNENVMIAPNGQLEAIVRIGVSAQVQPQINAAQQALDKLKNDRDSKQDLLDVLDGNGKGSIKEAENKLKEGLKSGGGFMDRIRDLKVGSVLTSALFDTVKNAPVPSTPLSPYEINNLNDDIKKYLSYQGGDVIQWVPPTVTFGFDINDINAHLQKVVKPAQLTKQEEDILDDLSNALAGEGFLEKTENLIVNGNRDYCPLCHQAVSPAHKHTLEQRLKQFRDKQVEDFKDEIRAILPHLIPVSSQAPAELPESSYQNDIDAFNDAHDKLNGIIAEIYTTLQSKIDNPFSPIPAINTQQFDALVTSYQNAINQIANDVNDFNTQIQQNGQLLAAIKDKNIEIAVKENLSWHKELNNRESQKQTLIADLAKLNPQIQKKEDEIKNLKGQQNQIDFAKDQINMYLKHIFGGDKLRLIENGPNAYSLQIKEKGGYVDLPPTAISSGERNALGLAYFFGRVMDQKDNNYSYGEPTLLVIDDPVSSFDEDNKAGVISLVADESENVLKGNPKSKVLIFTHDYTTLKELTDLKAKLIEPGRDQLYGIIKSNHSFMKRKCSLILDNMEYYDDLHTLFKFANFYDPDEYDNVESMGNFVRGFAENYATRMYKTNWKDMFEKDQYLTKLPENCKKVIRTFAIQNVLNANSHKSIAHFSPKEVQRAAKYVLIHIFHSFNEHLACYFKLEEMQTIEEWSDNC